MSAEVRKGGVVILSRGQRLERLFSSIGRELSRDTPVAAMIEERERPLWSGIEAVTLAEAARGGADVGQGDIAAIEAETGLTVYQAARNYLLYGRLHSEVFGWKAGPWRWESEEQIVAEYLESYRAIRNLLDRHAPSIVLLEAPDTIYAALAQMMAYKRGALTVGLYFAPLAGDCSMFLYTGFQPQNVLLRYYWDNPGAIPEHAMALGAERIASTRSSGPRAIAYVSEMSARSRGVVGPMVRKAVGAVASREQWHRFGPRALGKRAQVLRKELWLRRQLRRDIPPEPFVLYYMQHQPEASATTQAPHAIDQMQLIEQMAVNAPGGWRIVVKEHPRTYPARGEGYFRPLVDLPNVHLCHPSVSSHALLEKARCVVTLTGSVGIEALFMGKPVAVIGRPYYAFFPKVMRLERAGDLFAVMSGSGVGHHDEGELERFAGAYYASVFDAGKLADDRMWPEPGEGGVRIADAVRRHMALITSGALCVADYAPFQR
jgi:hypothetical protein